MSPETVLEGQPRSTAGVAGRIALVTGAAGGIGSATARLLAEHGAVVASADRSSIPADLAATTGGSVHTVDVSSPASVASLVADVVATHGTIDILVNSAGVLRAVDFLDLTTEQFDESLDVNLRGVFLMGRAVARHMVEHGGGRIVNVASQLAIKGGVGLSHYTAAKAGVLGLTKSMALELAPRGVLVNAIAPGPIETAMMDEVSDEWRRRKVQELPLGRFGTPEEVAPTVLLLAGSPGGDLYVGQTLGPNSGDVMP